MNSSLFKRSLILIFLFVVTRFSICAQGLPGTAAGGSGYIRLRTAVPFLNITPDARTSAMGEAGAALSSDVNSLSMNPSRIAFMEPRSGFSLYYSPWLRSIASGINLAYLSGYYKIDQNSTLAASLRYFSLGQIELTDANQQDLGTFSPNEFAADVTYARKFGSSFSMATSIRYIYSGLSSSQFGSGQQGAAGKSVAADVSAYFRKPAYLLGHDAIVAAGINISNIGTKMYYDDGGENYFLPANLKIGGASTFILDDLNEITVAADFNKLLVPEDPYRSVPSGIFGSFSDSAQGLSGELKEISIGSGIEYSYNKRFALRTGYFYENKKIGDRRYFTLGTGIKYEAFNLDFSYLLANVKNSPLANTLRFTLLFNFGEL
jgi:hypothetical protein